MPCDEGPYNSDPSNTAASHIVTNCSRARVRRRLSCRFARGFRSPGQGRYWGPGRFPWTTSGRELETHLPELASGLGLDMHSHRMPSVMVDTSYK